MTDEIDRLQQPVLTVARKDVATLRADFTIQEALEAIRQRGIGEKIVYFYVVDGEERLPQGEGRGEGEQGAQTCEMFS